MQLKNWGGKDLLALENWLAHLHLMPRLAASAKKLQDRFLGGHLWP
jgi:hypothetical protein